MNRSPATALLVLAVALGFLTITPEATAQTPLGTFAEVDRPRGILQLDDGRVLVANGAGVYAFTEDGTPLGIFSSTGQASHLIQHADGRVLVTSSEAIGAYDSNGAFLSVFAENLDGSSDLVQLADGRVLVGEYGSGSVGRVSEFAADGTPRGRFARQLRNVSAVAQLDDGRVLVFELGITAFSPDGTPLGTFRESVGPGTDIVQLPDGRILLVGVREPGETDERRRVESYAPDGTYLGPFASGFGSGTFEGAYGAAVLADGRVLISDTGNDVVLAYGIVPVAEEPAPEASGVGTVSPSPLAAGQLARMEVTPEAAGVIALSVFDARGRRVAQSEVAVAAGRQRLALPTADLAPGVYAVRVSGTGLSATRRVAIVR